MDYEHIPVMLDEVVEFLQIKKGGTYIDCTLGGAGYTLKIAEKVGKEGKVLAIDMDENAINNAKRILSEKGIENVKLVQDNFKNIDKITTEHFKNKKTVDGIVLDLGLSSFQLDDKSRGFSFKSDAPLDMSFGSKTELSTEYIINSYSLDDLVRVFKEYGEERRAYKIAKAIISQRRLKKIETTTELAELVKKQYPFRYYYKIHPATKVFQALRIETNQELKNLEEVLPIASKMLSPGGRIVVVSFHSGEDRIVKWFLKKEDSLNILTKKPLEATDTEKDNNPRSRSAKLRAADKKD